VAKELKRSYWQICMECDNRVYSPDPSYCTQHEGLTVKMIPASEHPDNLFGTTKESERKGSTKAGQADRPPTAS
jgi:hypothetical protein